jgi:hypothetical protein
MRHHPGLVRTDVIYPALRRANGVGKDRRVVDSLVDAALLLVEVGADHGHREVIQLHPSLFR